VPASDRDDVPRGITARELFDRAVPLDPEARRRLLDEANSHSPEACAEVESLLAFHDADGAFLDRPALSSAEPPAEAVPDRLGRYTVLRVLGTGGMGVVYEATQESPRRTVAVKVIRPSLLSPALLKRFSHEAAALARLQHPGIAQVFDAGVLDDRGASRPFIAMELVRGRPLTQHARDLPLRSRLELFARVCDAVEHAHRRAVVHRDLKPGNILVDAEGNPKVLDFGVARLTDSDARVTTVSTSVGQIIGTLAYMSPEQAAADPTAVDERTDVYALGVILFELLTGRLPIDPGAAPVHEALRAIAADEPRSLSTFDRRLRGDLDTLARRALEKDKSRRYQRAAELAADVRRYLNHEPIAARPPSALYQFSKFARRNRALVAGAAAVVVTLIAGIVATTIQAVHASDQATRARELAAFMKRMIRSATPEETRGQDTTVREMLDGAARDMMTNSSLDPSVAADAHRMFAEAYAKLGDFAAAETHARRALALQVERVGPDHADALAVIPALGGVLTSTDRAPEALVMTRQAWETAERTLDPRHQVLRELTSAVAGSLHSQPAPDWPEALRWRRLSCDLYTRALGPDDPETLMEFSNLGVALMEADQDAEAETVLRSVLAARRRTLGDDHPDTLVAAANVLGIKTNRGDPPGTILPEFEELVSVSRRVLGPQHPATLARLRNLCIIYFRAERLADAERTAAEAREGCLARLGPAHSDTLAAQGMHATALLDLGRVAEAEPIVHQLYQTARDNFPEKHPAVISAITLEYDLAEKQGDLPAMRRWAEALRGTRFEGPVFEQLKAAEEAEANKAVAPGK